MPGLKYIDLLALSLKISRRIVISICHLSCGQMGRGIFSQTDRLFRADAVVSHGPTSPVLNARDP